MKKTLAALVVIWLPCAIATVAAVPVAFVAIVVDEMPYGKDVLRAMDKLAAAVLGWSGRYTVSAECGASSCRFCAVVCWLLERVQPGHCAGAAKREGLR